MSLFFIAIVQSLLFSAVLSQGTCKETSDVKFTFYGMADGGDTTAFSCGNNGGKAGGTGSYSNPETFATSRSNTGFSKCEIVYIPYLQKYFQFTDYCVQCDTDYSTNKALHIDLWIGSDTNGGPAQVLCEDTFGSVPGQAIIQSPPSTLPVNSGALWDGSSCHDASSSSPFVYPNPSSSGLCSGGSSSPSGGAPVGGQTLSSGSSSTPPSTPTPSSTPSLALAPAPSTTPTTQPSITPVVEPPVSSPSSSSASSVTPSITPTTLMTLVATSSSSSSSTAVLSTTSLLPNYSVKTAKCASGHGCLGDPCQSFDDCAGDWICMGVPKICHDNRLD